MLAIERLARRVRRVPLTILIGLALMATGVLLGVAPLGSTSHHDHTGLGGEHFAHMIVIAGMVLVLAGVVAHGVRTQRRA
jgi:hypothetical protein